MIVDVFNMNKIVYYKSAICPRCRATDQRLSELQRIAPDVQIEFVEVLKDPARALRNGVLMLPTIVIGERRWHYAPSISELQLALKADSTSS